MFRRNSSPQVPPSAEHLHVSKDTPQTPILKNARTPFNDTLARYYQNPRRNPDVPTWIDGANVVADVNRVMRLHDDGLFLPKGFSHTLRSETRENDKNAPNIEELRIRASLLGGAVIYTAASQRRENNEVVTTTFVAPDSPMALDSPVTSLFLAPDLEDMLNGSFVEGVRVHNKLVPHLAIPDAEVNRMQELAIAANANPALLPVVYHP